MPTFLVTVSGHLVYDIPIDADTAQEAKRQAEYEAGESGEAFLKSGELQDAWIDVEAVEPASDAEAGR